METDKAGKKDRIIVICVDRDNDLGVKAGVEAPVIGREKVIDAATRLGLRDPEDTDFNSMFEAARVYDELKKQHDAEVCILTGDTDVGIKSDRKINEQLGHVLKHFHANFAVLVSDGSEDEQVIPVIQSSIPILSVKRVVVRQSQELESTYFKVKDFIKESLENPKLARVVFGIPALALMLAAVFGAEGWRAVMALLGVYLLIKGFKLESYFTGTANELRETFNRKRLAFFLYMLGVIFAALAAYWGYSTSTEWIVIGAFECAAAFLHSSVFYFWLAGSMVWIGRGISSRKRSARRIAAIPIFGIAISIVIFNGSNLVLQPDYPITNFIVSIVAGFLLLFGAVFLEKK